MEMLRRSSVFAVEVFDRSPTDKELVSQAKVLCREYIHSRLNRAGIGWSKPEHGLTASCGTLGEISSVLLWLGDELEYLRPNVYRNVARQLNITVASESIVSDAFLAVAADIFSTGVTWGQSGFLVRRGRSPGSGLRSPWSSSDGSYHCRLHGGVCPQEPDLLVEKERRLGGCNKMCGEQ
ncbi:Bcl-2-related ovarian killer protein-like protein A [Larimichthys crocea]|uniref:Uncharacterized protein n=1 Tax=Larimichthys crocea TaxID=215358 RepID=A0ACD3RMJ2_LARCR|nr:Bcl-2-related ovarian killer protein-like protein A [Larimichthys crocea]